MAASCHHPLSMFSIGVISDTHLHGLLPDRLRDELSGVFGAVQLIMHAGDIYSARVLDDLERFAPVVGCCGYSIDYDLQDPRLKLENVVEVAGLRFGLRHGLDYPPAYPNPSLARIMADCFGGRVDVFVHGDSHVPLVEWFEGTLLVNPGSPTLSYNCYDRPGTVAVITIDDAGVPQAKIHTLVYPLVAGEAEQ